MIKRALSYCAFLLLLVLSNISADSNSGTAPVVPSGFNAGPDIVAGNMADLAQYGAVGTQRGLATGITSCNAGNQVVGFFAMPSTDHPAVAQNLYRQSGGSNNNDRFEQIGQSWVKHTYGAKQANSCNFGCQPGGNFTHLGVGCSDTYFSSQSAEQSDLGSRAWINPFTGVFPSTARNHTGHVHSPVSHMMVVESDDLNQTLNANATYYAELVYVTPNEYTWCQAHPGECNMFNNASYLQYSVFGTTSFSFAQVGSPMRMMPAVDAWTGATIKTIEPEPGVDGRAFLAYKVTGPVGGLYHYEYAIFNLNLDRGIQSFSVPRLLVPGGGEVAVQEQNVGFHAPPQPPGFPNDGTQGDAGFSGAEWTYTASAVSLTWNSETFAQNPNANAIRWGTLYNFRFDSISAPVTANATVGFFKTGAPITVEIQGPAPTGGPFPTPTPTPTPCPECTPTPCPECTPTPTATATPTATLTATPTPTPTPTPISSAQALNLSTRMLVQAGDGAAIGGFIITGTDPKNILIRGLGPSLGSSGVPNALVDPVLELHGPDGFPTVVNDNWMDWCAGGLPHVPPCFPVPPGLGGDPLEPIMYLPLDPGAYTVIMQGNGNPVGIGLVEVYDLGPEASSKLANLSTRAFVGTGSDILIAGFILGSGSGDDRVVVRGLGPSLGAAGLSSVLANPTLDLRDSNGAIIRANNDWQDDPIQAALLTKLGLAPPNNLESGIVATLQPGSYTALLSGVDTGIGLGLVEVYDNPAGPTPTPGVGGTPTPTPGGGTPTPPPPTPTEPPPIPCTENFDGVTAPALPPGWIASNPVPGDGVEWVTSTMMADSAPNCAFLPDQDGISEKVLDRQVTVLSSSAMLTFRNNFNTEFSGGVYWDGGVLEISTPSISNGDFLDFTDARVGAICLAGCYTGELPPPPGPIPGGRMAWSGNSGGYIDTVINLGPNLAGQTVTLRWRFISDEAVSAPGWRIDTLSITGASCQ